MSDLGGEPDPLADEGLTRRLKALACTAPLHDLEVRKANQPWLEESIRDRYQMAEVALDMIDQVAIAMDFESGARHAQVLSRAERFIARQASDRPSAEHARIAVWVLESLINVRDVDRGFTRKYGWINTEGRYSLKTFDFKILEERSDSRGDLYLRASNEALNVLVGALDTDVESAQIAAEVRLRNLIARGRLADAKAVAEQARLRTIQYGETIRTQLEATERNVAAVDWLNHVPDLLNEALAHVESRQKEEQAIAQSITDDRDKAQDAANKRRAAELVDIVEDCIRRHTALHRRLLGAREKFRQEQDRQLFAPATRRAAVDLHRDLLQPILAETGTAATPPLSVFVEHSAGPTSTDQPGLATLIPALLAPPVQRSRFADEEEEPEPTPAEQEGGFSDEQWRAAHALLDLPDAARRLSHLLQEAALIDPPLPELVALLVLRAFSPQIGPALRHGQDHVLIAVPASTTFAQAGFAGDDLLVTAAQLTPNAAITDEPEQEPGS
ncbi:hypothetical protein ACFZDK_48965 [Streptomyces sp. NPDC007901]|uniref:hypothetical protein n=1 Tax=Streptomyces sp. NPDC007901 TaxID=3364785 RepID=UPI0036F03947